MVNRRVLPIFYNYKYFYTVCHIEISCTTSVPRPIKFHGTCLTAALLNSQSARNKVDLIGEAVIEHDIDTLALTETWLTNTPKDEYYTKELSFSGYKLINVPRPGGGVTVEEWQSYIKTVYQLKLSSPVRMSSPGRLVILGDLNFHVDNASDSNAKKFLDLLDLLNFSQHVTSITHKAGHTLDLVITRDSEAVIDNVTVSDLLSDHALVLVRVKHPKSLPTRITTITRKLRSLDATSLAAEVSTLASKTFHTDASPDSIAERYNSILAAALDKFAPCRTKIVTRRPSPLHEAKCRRRQAERTWR